MFKKISFLAKRDGMAMREFVDYYENNHVPLILGLAPTPDCYKRRYILRGDQLNIREGDVDFDVVTEVGFHDRASYLAWGATLGAGAVGAQVAEDEAKFLDRSRTRSFTVEEHVTSG